MSVTVLEPTSRESWGAVRVVGEGARDYLQGQLTQDLDDVGDGAWALLLEPDGSVVSGVRVASVEGGYDLVVPDELCDLALARLRRFALRSRCEIDRTDPAAPWFDSVGDRVAARWPGSAEFARALSAQSYGDGVVAASVSFTKGCYTGQELVARLDARAATVPWGLVTLSGPDLDAIEARLRASGPEGARGVTTAVRDGEGVRALGVAHRSLRESAGRRDDVELEFL